MRDSIQKLRDVEEAIAISDRQRLLAMRTTELAVATVMRESWDELKATHAVSEMVARRMFNQYRAQKELKRLIGLSISPSASGFFQQAVGTYLRAYLESVGEYGVYLDRLYNGRLRPDVAVERGKERLAVIEVKTDLGWNREYVSSGGWDRRKRECLEAGFRAAYLLILANTNWPGYSQTMDGSGVRVLLWTHPNDRVECAWYQQVDAPLTITSSPGQWSILHPIEELFEEIAHLA